MDSQIPFHQHVAEQQAAWKAEAKALTQLATAVGPLAREAASSDIATLEATLAKVARRVNGLSSTSNHGPAFLKNVELEIEHRKTYQRENLSRELNQICAEAGIRMRVVRKDEPIEVRIPPFAVLIDRAKGRAEIHFARQRIDSCASDAEAIMKMHRRACEALQQGFNPASFFTACRMAWRAARGAGKEGAGDRVEILDFLPYLALQLQTRAFAVEPSAKNFRGYSRARFSYDLHQLRCAGGLSQDGWRLNLGVATGTTATKKNRALFIEDENGNGEFKLTVFFTRTENGR